ncbi:MAG: hypothetical protein WC890_07420 [Candidatus Margulisiibacteriota bacterium]
MQQIINAGSSLRAYPNLAQLQFDIPPHQINLVPKGQDLREATTVKLVGEDFTEHSAGGDATRLGMGAKFVIEPLQLAGQARLAGINFTVDPNTLLPLSLGKRHMAQFAYDLTRLAAQYEYNPHDVLHSQFMLITLNPKTADAIIQDFVRYNFFGFNPERVLFFVDQVYSGMMPVNGEIVFSQNSPIGLYNHGHMVLQETVEGEVFQVVFNSSSGEIRKVPIGTEKFEEILASQRNKISYPVEDNDYLTGQSIDLDSLGLALQLGAQGARMIMEVVGQKPLIRKPNNSRELISTPQKGGFLAFDPTRGRLVMIESDSGDTVVNEKDPESLAKIKHLNRNFNLFPRPVEVFRALMNQGLPFLHPVVRDGFLYIQPPQGDQNFLVPTAFVRQEGEPKPINNLKSIADAERTLRAMQTQDQQYGFTEFMRELGLVK